MYSRNNLEGKVTEERADGVERGALESISNHFIRVNTPDSYMKRLIDIFLKI